MERIRRTRVRPGRMEHLEAVVEIYNHYVVNTPASFEIAPVKAEERRNWFDEHSREGRHRLVVAVGETDRVLGWAATSPFRPRAGYDATVECSVYCRPEDRGRGIGSDLYHDLFESIANEDIERIVAGVALPNAASIALHERFGFRSVGTFSSVGRKFGRFWDVQWFERGLRSPLARDEPREAPRGLAVRLPGAPRIAREP